MAEGGERKMPPARDWAWCFIPRNPHTRPPPKKSYSYYDTPDGHDCFHKTWYLSKYGAMAGGVWAMYDVLFYSHPQGYFQTAARVGYSVLPFTLAAGTFAAMTCVSTSLRGKDDPLNYINGGVAAASILGAWKRSIMLGFVGAIVLGSAGAIKKFQKIEGWDFYKEGRAREYTTVFVEKHNYTLFKDGTRGWTTGKD